MPEPTFARDREAARWLLCAALACLTHGACVAYFAQRRAEAAAPRLRELEVELLAPEPPPPPAPPQPAPAEPPPAQPVRAPARSNPAAEPAQPARAGALLTQPETPAPQPATDEPVRFVTDPGGRGYGSGLVARDGTAERADGLPAAEPEAPASAAKRAGLVFAAKLSRQPVLATADPCRGYFPKSARSDRGEVSAIATVRDHGAVARTEIEREAPLGQGFGAAARACLAQQRFEPALDDAGKRTAARIRVRIAFTR